MESIVLDEEEVKLGNLTHEQMQIFCRATTATIEVVIKKDLNLPVDKLILLIKEVYEYSMQINPPTIDDRFIHWIIDRHNKL